MLVHWAGNGWDYGWAWLLLWMLLWVLRILWVLL